MEFQEWFLSQFGPAPQQTLREVQNQLEELQKQVEQLKEKRYKIQEYHGLQRAAMYAWNANKKPGPDDTDFAIFPQTRADVFVTAPRPPALTPRAVQLTPIAPKDKHHGPNN